MTQDAIATAIKTALNTALAPYVAYDFDDLHNLATKPKQYVEVALIRRYSETSRLCGDKPLNHWRFTTRAVADTVTNARTLLDETTAVLKSVSLPVGADATTPIQFETEDPIRWDEVAWTGLTAWTFAI